jgi:hypothetical protein
MLRRSGNWLCIQILFNQLCYGGTPCSTLTTFQFPLTSFTSTLGRNVLGAYGVYDVGMKLVFNRLFEDRDLSAEVNGRLAISVTRFTLSDRLISF